VPHDAVDAALLRLLPFVDRVTADATASTYQISQASLAHAVSQGWAPSVLWSLLTARAGALPAAWQVDLDPPPAQVQILATPVLVADVPSVLSRAVEARSVRRHLGPRLAPGMAQVAPEDVAPLTRALERQGIACVTTPSVAPPDPKQLSPGECAALLVACAYYQQHARPDTPLVPTEQVEARLRAALPPALRVATDQTISAFTGQPAPPTAIPWEPCADTTLPAVLGGIIVAPSEHSQEDTDAHQPSTQIGWIEQISTATDIKIGENPPHPSNPCSVPMSDPNAATGDPAAQLAVLRRAIAAQRPVALTYTTATAVASERVVRPLEVQQQGEVWYLRAYCTLRHAERTFRLDRIQDIAHR
jgi:hypothetical protein